MAQSVDSTPRQFGFGASGRRSHKCGNKSTIGRDAVLASKQTNKERVTEEGSKGGWQWNSLKGVKTIRWNQDWLRKDSFEADQDNFVDCGIGDLLTGRRELTKTGQRGIQAQALLCWNSFVKEPVSYIVKMSSPSGHSEETRSQDSVHASLQFAAGMALEDTAASVHHTGHLPGGSSTVTSRAPNAAFSQGMAAARARSASPGPRRSPSPLGLSVAQRRAQLAELIVAMAMSGVGCVEAETHCICKIVEATTAEARSVRDEVQSRVASLAALADTSTLRTVEEIAKRVREVAAYSRCAGIVCHCRSHVATGKRDCSGCV